MFINLIFATLINFTWQPPTSGPVVEGYKLLIGDAPGQYTQEIDVGNTTSTQQDIDVSTTKYFAVVAYNLWGDSTPSNEVVAENPSHPSGLTAAPN
jgi:hypothetical protein